MSTDDTSRRRPGAPGGSHRKPQARPTAATPRRSYVARLLHKGPDAFLKKIGEEATEVVMAAKDVDHGGDRAASWWARWPTCGSTA